MTEVAQVTFASDNGGKEQFGKILTYRNGRQRRKSLIFISIIAMVGVLVPTLLFGPPTEETVNNPDIFSIPQITGVEKRLDLPPYSRSEDLKRQDAKKGEKPASTKAYGKPLKLPGPQLLSRPRDIKIPPGVMVKAELVSGASNGLVKAEIKENVLIYGETLISAGTFVMGQGSSSENRLFIKFNRLVFTDGTMETTSAEACDIQDKTPGLKGSQVGYQALKLAAGVGLNFAGGLAEGLQDTEGQQGAAVRPATMKNALLNGAAHASLDQSRELMADLRNRAPLIEIAPGQIFYLTFSDGGS